MKVTVKLFGAEAQAAGTREATIDLPASATCADLRRALAAAIPGVAARMDGCRIAVNHEFATDTTVIREADEVALIGPVSGG
jgi:molybdopterin synthase catalytic subunit